MLSWHSDLGRRMPICAFPGFGLASSPCAPLRVFHARFTLKRSQPSTVALIPAMIASVLWPTCPAAETQ
jgi:hypothetical protein